MNTKHMKNLTDAIAKAESSTKAYVLVMMDYQGLPTVVLSSNPMELAFMIKTADNALDAIMKGSPNFIPTDRGPLKAVPPTESLKDGDQC